MLTAAGVKSEFEAKIPLTSFLRNSLLTCWEISGGPIGSVHHYLREIHLVVELDATERGGAGAGWALGLSAYGRTSPIVRRAGWPRSGPGPASAKIHPKIHH